MKDKVVLITGGAQGIGATLSRLFVEGGAKTAFSDIDEAAGRAHEEALSRLGEALFVKADVSDAAQVQAMVDAVVARWGRLDVLVNNAGIIRDALAHKMTDDDFDSVVRTHLKGTYLCSRAAYAAMRKQGSGRIVNTSSVSALGNMGQANYAAAKAGIIGLTRTLALEFARWGINVNCVMPGFVETRMTTGLPEKVRERLIAKIPLGRFARPEEIARLHLFLAGEDSGYVTGQTFCVDGGLTVGF